MSNNQYDVDEETLRLFKLKQQQRSQAKAYFRQLITNPHRPIRDGVPFDPVFYRYNAMGPYQIEHFRPNVKNTAAFLGFLIIPMIAVYQALTWTQNRKEELLRSGAVAYKDRESKVIF